MPNYRKVTGGLNRSRSTFRIPVVTSEHIASFTGGTISNNAGMMYNVVVDKYAGEQDRLYITQRPTVGLFDDASDTVSIHYDTETGAFGVGELLTGGTTGATGTIIAVNDQGTEGVLSVTPLAGAFTSTPETITDSGTGSATSGVVCDNTKGRGTYYWGATGLRFFVNDTCIYRVDYDHPVAYWTNSDGESTGMTSGGEKVYFIEWSSVNTNYLFIINPAASQVFVIDDSLDTLAINVKDVVDDAALALAGTGAPFDAGDSWDFSGMPMTSTLGGTNVMAHGAEVLDKYFILAKKNAEIYTSNVDDFLIWSALDFTTAERENDQLLAISKSGDHILALGERTTELFYDAANPTGSPLAPRKDVFYQKGIANGENVWTDGNDVYFLGVKPTGDFLLYVVKDFKIKEISSSTLSSYLRHGRTEATLSTTLSGFSSGAHTYLILTVYNASGQTIVSLVYDAYSGLWGEWETTLIGLTDFPLVGWSTRTPETPVTAEGIFNNGDLFYINDNFVPLDTTATTAYFVGSYSTGDYSTSSSGDETTDGVIMKVEVTNIELDSSDDKFMHKLQAVANLTLASQTLTVEWSDDEGVTWYSGTLDTSYYGQINRLGKFVRRRFRLTYQGTEALRLEALDVTCTQGGN
jgi:hypothetical protein